MNIYPKGILATSLAFRNIYYIDEDIQNAFFRIPVATLPYLHISENQRILHQKSENIVCTIREM